MLLNPYWTWYRRPGTNSYNQGGHSRQVNSGWCSRYLRVRVSIRIEWGCGTTSRVCGGIRRSMVPRLINDMISFRHVRVGGGGIGPGDRQYREIGGVGHQSNNCKYLSQTHHVCLLTNIVMGTSNPKSVLGYHRQCQRRLLPVRQRLS